VNAAVSSLTLGGKEIDLWRVDLDVDDAAQSNTLSADELARARRYLSSQVRQCFVSSRTALRTILAKYLHTEPGELCFQYTPAGKPALGRQFADSPLRFNLSHSKHLMLVAVAWEHELGVDVEHIRMMPEEDTIAADFFSPAEYEIYRTLPGPAKQQAFFACWTRKEAYLKACGGGLAISLSGFQVTFAPGEPARLLKPAEGDLRQWEMHDLNSFPGYAAALVIET
jgi:4'-phosphopantetheinyl transferase